MVPLRFYTSERQCFAGSGYVGNHGNRGGYLFRLLWFKLLFVSPVCAERRRQRRLARGCYSRRPVWDGWMSPSLFVVSTGVPVGFMPRHTHAHTHTCAAPQPRQSYVSNAVNQQAPGPVAIPPDCWTQLAYLRTVCAR